MTTNEHADAHFQWWWRWKTTTTLEDEHKCSFSRVGKGGDAGIVSAGADAAGGCRHPSCCCHCLCWQPQLQLLLLLLLVLPCVHVETSLSCHVTVSKRKKKEESWAHLYAYCPHCGPLLCPRLLLCLHHSLWGGACC